MKPFRNAEFDGQGLYEIDTGIGFLDHVTTAITAQFD